MFGLNPYVLLALAAAFASTAAGSFWAGKEWEQGAQAQRDIAAMLKGGEQRRTDAKRIDTAATGHEADKREIRTEFVVITQEVERVVKEPFYRDAAAPACLDDDGLRQLTAAITGPRAAASQPARAVPGPRPAD